MIVANDEMRGALEADASNPNGIYHPYPITTTTQGSKISGVGYAIGDSLIRSGIGTFGDGASSVFYDGSSESSMYGIYVNPHGLFCSWTEGSLESALEAAWAYQAFHDESYDLRSDVDGFYRVAYGYDLSDDEYEAILAGRSI